MKNTNEKYQVLWIDDQPDSVFADEAYRYGIRITVRTNYAEGLKLLEDRIDSWDSVILDAYCKLTSDPNEAADIKSLTEGMHQVAHICKKYNIPWFVYSAGTNEADLNTRILDKSWDSKPYYKKPSERKDLFNKIIEVVNLYENPSWIIRNKYADVFELFQSTPIKPSILDQDHESALIQIVALLERIETERDNTAVFNKIRKFLEAVLIPKLQDLGMVNTKTYKEDRLEWKDTSLNDVRKVLTNWDYTARIPTYIQRCAHSLINIVQNGSHNSVQDDSKLDVVRDVSGGSAPYLVQTSILLLLNVLTWLKHFATNYADMADNIEFFSTQPQHIIRVGDIVKTKLNKNGYLCAENILLGAYKPGTNANREVVLTKVSINTQSNKHLYYYVGEFKEKE